jgi:hypothetical protein
MMNGFERHSKKTRLLGALTMAFVKRRKKPRPQSPRPGRQVICGICGTPLLVDDSPGDEIPAYKCSNCGTRWSPTEQRLVVSNKHKGTRVFQSILAAKAKKQKVGQPGGADLHWGVWQPTKADAQKRRRLDREAEILSKAVEQLRRDEYKWIMKMTHRLYPGLDLKTGGRGRKRDSKYQQWLNDIETAEICGKRRPFLRDLAGITALNKRSRQARNDILIQMQKIRDAFKKAKKRRQVPAPPKR